MKHAQTNESPRISTASCTLACSTIGAMTGKRTVTKALVLSGGAGTRLRPITQTLAEQLVPMANQPILFYGPWALREAGISDVGIIVGETAAEVRAAVGDGATIGLAATYIPQEYEGSTQWHTPLS